MLLRIFVATLLLCACFISTASAEDSKTLQELGMTTLTRPSLNMRPSPKYWSRTRMWQGIPSIDRTPGGRLWATWYAGPLAEGSEGNYAVLVTSGDDGRTWSKPVAAYDPGTLGAGNSCDPHVWVDPDGNLWWFVNRSLSINDPHGHRSVWAFRAKDPESDQTKWRYPVFAGYGVALNKPIVLADGTWLRPVDSFQGSDPERTQFYISRDKGESYEFLSKTPVKDVVFSEHMAVERRDGSLLTLARTTYGIAQLESFDQGRTWKNDRPFTTEFNINTRFYIGRLKSGAMLLVVNDDPKSRTHMTAKLSEDDGKTWPYKLLLDERRLVSYPDATEGSNGFLYITYDRGRYAKDEQEILFAKITEADIKAGKLVNAESRLQQVIDRLADSGGGVHFEGESTQLRKEYEALGGK